MDESGFDTTLPGYLHVLRRGCGWIAVSSPLGPGGRLAVSLTAAKQHQAPRP
jgi:hypothetical protein